MAAASTDHRETVTHSDLTTDTRYETHFLARLRQTSRIVKTGAEKPLPISRGGEKKSDSFCCRVFYVAMIFYILFAAVAFLIWFFGAVCDDRAGCLRRNNYVYSFTPMLTYTNGPPPVWLFLFVCLFWARFKPLPSKRWYFYCNTSYPMILLFSITPCL